MHGRGEVRDEAEQRRVELGVDVADLHDLGRVRSHRRVDLVGQLEVELLGDRQQPAEQLRLRALDAHEREAELLGAVEECLRELVLLVRGHVAVAAAAHVEVGAERAGVEAVLVEGRAPRAHELVSHVGIGRQHLRGDDLDARGRCRARRPGSSRPSKSYQPARNSALAEYSVSPSENGSSSAFGGGGVTAVVECRCRRIPVRDGQLQRLVHEVGNVHAGTAVLAGSNLHVRQAQLADELGRCAARRGQQGCSVVAMSKGCSWRYQSSFALRGQVRERIADTAQFQGQVPGGDILAVDGEPQAGDRGEPQAPVPRQGQGKRETVGMGAEACIVKKSVWHCCSLYWEMGWVR